MKFYIYKNSNKSERNNGYINGEDPFVCHYDICCNEPGISFMVFLDQPFTTTQNSKFRLMFFCTLHIYNIYYLFPFLV